MLKIKNWRAARSGGRITVYGDNAAFGDITKLTNVERITAGPRGADYCIATDKGGNEHHLLLG